MGLFIAVFVAFYAVIMIVTGKLFLHKAKNGLTQHCREISAIGQLGPRMAARDWPVVCLDQSPTKIIFHRKIIAVTNRHRDRSAETGHEGRHTIQALIDECFWQAREFDPQQFLNPENCDHPHAGGPLVLTTEHRVWDEFLGHSSF
jgi:hypothetical protein